jgi:hypothetical protein
MAMKGNHKKQKGQSEHCECICLDLLNKEALGVDGVN